MPISKARTRPTADQILDLITTSLENDKADDILSISLAGKSSMADYMVIASGTSSRQVSAMAQHLETKLKEQKVTILGLEGLRQADWVLLDANDVVVHLFRPEVREFYGLERMWSDDTASETVKVGSDA
ncbi:MAG: ribosome silencing factor [Candidatus Puniceispirillum sp.]